MATTGAVRSLPGLREPTVTAHQLGLVASATATGPTQRLAEALYAIYTGDISSRETRNDHHVQLGALKNRGAINIKFGDGTRYALTEDVAFAFDAS